MQVLKRHIMWSGGRLQEHSCFYSLTPSQCARGSAGCALNAGFLVFWVSSYRKFSSCCALSVSVCKHVKTKNIVVYKVGMLEKAGT